MRAYSSSFHKGRGSFVKATDTIALVDPSASTPPSVIIHRETNQKLLELINALPSLEATLIRAIYSEGLTMEEAGRRLGVSKFLGQPVTRQEPAAAGEILETVRIGLLSFVGAGLGE